MIYVAVKQASKPYQVGAAATYLLDNLSSAIMRGDFADD